VEHIGEKIVYSGFGIICSSKHLLGILENCRNFQRKRMGVVLCIPPTAEHRLVGVIECGRRAESGVGWRKRENGSPGSSKCSHVARVT
jgi:hypothetical protein